MSGIIMDILKALIPPLDGTDVKMRNWQITVAFCIYCLGAASAWGFGLLPAIFGTGYAYAGDMNDKFKQQKTEYATLDQSVRDVQKDLISSKIHDKEVERCRILAAGSRDIPSELRQAAVDTLNGFLNDKADEYKKLTGNNYMFQNCQLLLISAGK